jgi:hypothetical protein
LVCFARCGRGRGDGFLIACSSTLRLAVGVVSSDVDCKGGTTFCVGCGCGFDIPIAEVVVADAVVVVVVAVVVDDMEVVVVGDVDVVTAYLCTLYKNPFTMPNVINRLISTPPSRCRLSRTQFFNGRPWRRDVYSVIRSSWGMENGGSETGLGVGVGTSKSVVVLLGNAVVDDKGVEDVSEPMIDGECKWLPDLNPPTPTYLAHSSKTPSCVTNPPISAVGAYTAPKLKTSSSTKQP